MSSLPIPLFPKPSIRSAGPPWRNTRSALCQARPNTVFDFSFQLFSVSAFHCAAFVYLVYFVVPLPEITRSGMKEFRVH